MKIAVSSCGIFLDSPIDPRFGRCDYFVIVDTYDMSFEVIDNESNELTQGGGRSIGTFCNLQRRPGGHHRAHWTECNTCPLRSRR